VSEEAAAHTLAPPPFPRFVIGGITSVWEALTSDASDWIERFAALSAHAAGDRLQFEIGGEPVAGDFLGFDENGFLKLETSTGERRIRSGEIYSW
jgi:hypothetical protein